MDLMTERASGVGRLTMGRALHGKSPFLFLKSLFLESAQNSRKLSLLFSKHQCQLDSTNTADTQEFTGLHGHRGEE